MASADKEAAVDLVRLAGLSPVGVIGELVHDDGTMMRLDAVVELGREFDLPVVTIANVFDAQNPIPKLPPPLKHWQRFMNRALAKQPDQRFENAAEMGQAVTEMDNVTQQNASLVEEATAAAASLEDQAGKLTQAVAACRLQASPAATAMASRPAAPVKTVAVAPRQALAGSNENWETF